MKSIKSGCFSFLNLASYSFCFSRPFHISHYNSLYHIRTLLANSQDSNELDPTKQGSPPVDGKNSDEPLTCPYKIEDITTGAASSKRTASTDGQTLDSSIEKGSMGVGMKPSDKIEAPSNTAAKEQEQYGIKPVTSSMDMSVRIWNVLQYASLVFFVETCLFVNVGLTCRSIS